MFKLGEKGLFWIQVLFVVLGIAAIFYYVVIVSILGVRKDFALIWPAGGLGCLGIGFFIHQMVTQNNENTARLINGIMIIFVLLVVVFAVMEGIIIKAGFAKPDKNADYMIVLGAQVNGTKVSKALACRLDAAYKYAKENDRTKIIVSGGQGYKEEVTEAKAMKEYLVEKGLEEARIFMEEKSTNTNENIFYSKELIRDGDYVVIVTNRFHLLRGTKIAKKQLHQKVEGLGAKTGTVLFLNYYVREVFAMVKDGLLRHI